MNEPDVDGRTLSAAFERTMDGVGPDLGPLVAASARQGRSIRRRRRLTVAGAVTAVAAPTSPPSAQPISTARTSCAPRTQP